LPKVSVIIPTYNSASYVVEAVDSVLAQTYQDFEILVIDDGSTDNTADVIKKYDGRVRYIPQHNGGVAAARNNGIAESKGEYIAFLDADDTWFPSKLELQMAAIAERADARLCYSAFLSVTADLKPIGIRRSERWGTALEDLLLHGNVIGSICTVIAEASLLKSSGGFDRALSQCADWDMWVRLAAKSEFAYIDEPLVTYRQHDSNMSRNAPLLEKDSLRVLEKGFAMTQLPLSLRSRKRAAFARNFMVLAGTYFHAGHFRDFVRCAWRAISMDAKQLQYLLAFPVRAASRSGSSKEQFL
jgi:glycosyltransferase involved in cell wall biosynthesis